MTTNSSRVSWKVVGTVPPVQKVGGGTGTPRYAYAFTWTTSKHWRSNLRPSVERTWGQAETSPFSQQGCHLVGLQTPRIEIFQHNTLNIIFACITVCSQMQMSYIDIMLCNSVSWKLVRILYDIIGIGRSASSLAYSEVVKLIKIAMTIYPLLLPAMNVFSTLWNQWRFA